MKSTDPIEQIRKALRSGPKYVGELADRLKLPVDLVYELCREHFESSDPLFNMTPEQQLSAKQKIRDRYRGRLGADGAAVEWTDATLDQRALESLQAEGFR